jgi:hypothetical protein
MGGHSAQIPSRAFDRKATAVIVSDITSFATSKGRPNSLGVGLRHVYLHTKELSHFPLSIIALSVLSGLGASFQFRTFFIHRNILHFNQISLDSRPPQTQHGIAKHVVGYIIFIGSLSLWTSSFSAWGRVPLCGTSKECCAHNITRTTE